MIVGNSDGILIDAGGFNMPRKIESDKIELKELFEKFWFVVPEYQRPYVWKEENVEELLDDLWFAYENNCEDEYFCGTLVLRKTGEKEFKEFEILDGQQRLTTFALIFAVIRNITSDEELKDTMRDCLFQRGSRFKKNS